MPAEFIPTQSMQPPFEPYLAQQSSGFMQAFAALPVAAQYGFAIVFGLVIGSFLTVVVHRLPIMLERAWRAETQVADTDTDGEARTAPLQPRGPAQRLPALRPHAARVGKHPRHQLRAPARTLREMRRVGQPALSADRTRDRVLRGRVAVRVRSGLAGRRRVRFVRRAHRDGHHRFRHALLARHAHAAASVGRPDRQSRRRRFRAAA